MTPRDRSTAFVAGVAPRRPLVRERQTPSALVIDLLGFLIMLVLLGAYLVAG